MKAFKADKEIDIVWRKAGKDDIENVKKLRSAIKSNNVSEVKKMIKADKQLVMMTTVFGTFLHDAASVGNVETVKVLLKGGADINKNETLLECRPLAIAAKEGNLDVVKYLVKNGAIFDCSNILRNPIFKAIDGGYLDIVKYLVENDIDLSMVYDTESYGRINAYNYAKTHRKQEICEYLEEVYCEKNLDLNPQEQNPWVCTVHDDFTGKPFTSKRMEILEYELGVKVPEYFKKFHSL